MQPGTGLIVDDHAEAREWVEHALLQAFPGIHLETAHDLATAREAVLSEVPDLAVIDLGLPDGSGLSLISELQAAHPNTYKVVSTVFGDDRHLFDALRAGAQGYVLKDESRQALCAMFQGILKGEPPLSPSVARRVLKHFHAPREDPALDLTARERDVLTLLAKGCTVRHVAELLEITPNTVSGYVKTIYRKLNVSNRAEATLAASRRGLVTPESR